ncbi:hypothetical protein [Bifidobacterium bombi]|uniref:Uncharacterized protein n=1 Tax=Bifidobacterium bombi DSM 19703 TaxID=1341695 RepID=A0A086BNV4_9BIFI|nr:hypothetical protein [Bifidobacterium bombi]KFF30618.1 hypothetical protein BBOMB_1482 [Bifidobacterium bombi DSM 19703]
MKHKSLTRKLFTAVAILTIPVICTSTASASPVSFMGKTEVIAQNALRGADAVGIDTAADINFTSSSDEIVATSKDASIKLEKEGNSAQVTSQSGDTLVLPEEASGNVGVSDGTGVVAGKNMTDFAVNLSEEGNTRVTSVLNSKEAPERLDYTFADASYLTIEENGSVTIYDKDNQISGGVETPWAVDAQGKSVPTHYEVNGNVLTQVIEHNANDYAYPVTADPSWSAAFKWLGRGAKFLAKKVGPGVAVLCLAGAGWAWYRSDARGWVRVGDAVVGCIA